MSQMLIYETARESLAEALRVDEVLKVRDFSERMKLYGRQARDKRMVADAMALQLRAERKLGQLIISAKEAKQFGTGRPGASNLGGPPEGGEDGGGDHDGEQNSSTPVQFSRATLSEIGIDKKLSAKAQNWARLGDPEFEQHLKAMREKIEATGAIVVNPLKDLSTDGKKARRAEREAELGARQQALPVAKFGVIYADPEWRFEVRSEGGLDRAADNHYPTSDLEAIKSRDIGSLAAEDSVLFLWATAPMMPQALEVMAAWGFAYKSQFAWTKDRAGTGYWNRNRHELLLVGTRGAIPAPAPGTQWDSVIEAPVGKHSEKPDVFYELIEDYFPTLPKIELNARQTRKGWARWGLEAPGDVSGGDVSAESGLSQAKPWAEAPAAGEEAPDQDTETSAAMPGRGAGAFDAASAPAGEAAPSPATVAVTAPPPPAAPVPLPRDAGEDLNGIIRDGYGRDAAIAELMAATGLSKTAITSRAKRMGLGHRDRQRAAVAEANRRRAGA